MLGYFQMEFPDIFRIQFFGILLVYRTEYRHGDNPMKTNWQYCNDMERANVDAYRHICPNFSSFISIHIKLDEKLPVVLGMVLIYNGEVGKYSGERKCIGQPTIN